MLAAIDRLGQRMAATEFARRDLVAEVLATDAGFERQAIYRWLRRIAERALGSAHRDLQDLGRADCESGTEGSPNRTA